MLPRLELLILCHQVRSNNKLLFDEGLLVVLIELKESIERVLVSLKLAAEAPVVVAGLLILIGGALAVSAELLYLLGVIVVLDE
jgi:hypothetical protein